MTDKTRRGSLGDDPGDAWETLSGWVPGETVGRYRIVQRIGEGGMGVVYEALQESPIRRRVALKVIKPGMDSRAVIARFESERQSLALMNHPNIAGVLDAGATAQGRPYFAMEFVTGIPITDYCDRNRWTTRQRLELFVPVCEGVQHAHQKGIIHRDVKPSNVLVSDRDGRAVPKIIDFGIAKATGGGPSERTAFTGLGQPIGTPEYMSPEQADTAGLDVDTRTDVYWLGVLLYELLTGELPVDGRQLRAVGFVEFCRRIVEEEPPKPSLRVTREPACATAAARRRTERRVLSRQLRGDLDWIVMKALEKDRTRRYGSVSELAADVRRHLRHESVSASPPSTIYRVRKFVRRNRIAAGFATVLALTLIAVALGMTLQAGRIALERDRANQEAVQTQRVVRLLIDLFEESDPNRSAGPTSPPARSWIAVRSGSWSCAASRGSRRA